VAIIWVTRPEPFHHELMNELISKGHHALHFPCLRIIPLQLISLPESDWIVVTSQHAVSSCKTLLAKYQGKVFAVGPKTQKALLDIGLRSKIPSGLSNAESLYNEYLKNITGKGVLIDGIPRNPYLLSKLMVSNKKIEVVACYKREQVLWNLQHDTCLSQGLPDISIITSQQVLQSYLSLVKHASLPYKEIKTIVISQAIKKMALSEGIKDVVLVRHVDEIKGVEFDL